MIKIKNIIIIILSLSVGFLLLPISKVNADNNEDDKLLIIDNISIWENKDNKWYSVTNYDNNKNFIVYIDNKYYGVYKLKGLKNYTLYDNNNDIKSYNGNLFAYTNNFNIKNKTYNNTNVPNQILSEINSIMGISIEDNDLSINEYIKIDLDNNGVSDEIINVSNLDALDEQTKYFNLVYIKLNNTERQIIINDEVEPRNLLNAPIYNIKYIFNNNSTYDSMILEEGYFSNVAETKNILFENSNGLYNKVTIEIEQKNTEKIDNKADYTLYIVLAIILVIFLLGYFIFNKIKNREDSMDD